MRSEVKWLNEDPVDVDDDDDTMTEVPDKLHTLFDQLGWDRYSDVQQSKRM